MKIAEDHRKQIEQIINTLECPRRFECYRSALENLTPVEAGQFRQLIGCSRSPRRPCPLEFDFGFIACCTCPLRHYIVRHFGK